MPRTQRSVSVFGQIKAVTAAKSARLNEAGLGGNRTGKALATTKRAQASRDFKSAAARASGATAPVGTGTTAAKTVSAPASRKAGAVMAIQVNTSSGVPGGATFVADVQASLRTALARFAKRLTRIEAHFDDANAGKGGSDDKRCTLEARPASMQPLATSATARTAEQALKGASDKLKRLLTTRFAKQDRG